jgi:hypothetical protein
MSSSPQPILPGAIRQLLNMACTAGHQCWASEHVIREAYRNLLLKQRERIPDFEQLLFEINCASKLPDVQIPPLETQLPENDQQALAGAIALKCDAFVTGDETHFGPLYAKTVSGVAIYSPRQLAEVILR